jgi:hypothetical protein
MVNRSAAPSRAATRWSIEIDELLDQLALEQAREEFGSPHADARAGESCSETAMKPHPALHPQSGNPTT